MLAHSSLASDLMTLSTLQPGQDAENVLHCHRIDDPGEHEAGEGKEERQEQDGRNRTAEPMNASGSVVMPANQAPAGTAMIPAGSAAMTASPGQNQLFFAAMPARSSSESSARSDMPIAWSTPRQNVRSSLGRKYNYEKRAL